MSETPVIQVAEVRFELVQRLEEGVLSHEYKLLQTFLLDGVHETLREGIEVR